MSKSTDGYILYQTPYCPFCQMVFREIHSLGIEIEMKDTTNPALRQELVQGGGKGTVPCLKHPDGRWQYESRDIIAFLHETFA